MKITATERIEKINQKKATAANIAAVVEVYRQTRDNTPAETAAAIVNRLGYSVAVEAVAELVNTVGEWDARIFPSVREWAESQPTAASRDELDAMSIYQPSEIHPAHINQLAEAMSKYQPTEDSTKEEENTVKEFTEIKKAVMEDAEQTSENRRFFILNGYMPTWAEEHHGDLDRGLKQYSTARRWEQYKAGEITREKAVELATKRALKEIEKDTAAKLARLDRVAAAPDLTFISISVDWVRSRTWGNNPHAEARTNAGTFSGTASGCGYDKESTAIAEALNQCDSVLKVLYTLKENGLRAGLSDKSKTAACGRSNGDICGYGAGYGAIPYFEGGVGSSCFWSILKKCGFSTSCHHGKHSDFYSVEKEVA